MNTFGNVTPKTVVLTIEAHKLHLAFTIATGVQVWKGQQVKLAADGSITPFVPGDTVKDRIGVCIHTHQSTDDPFPYPSGGGAVQATVAMVGYTTVLQLSNAALVPGPVKLAAFDNTLGKGKYINTVGGDTNCDGWALDVCTAAGQDVNIVLH